MKEEGKAEASEDARKRASSTRVKTGDCGNPQSRRIAAVSFERERSSRQRTRPKRKESKQGPMLLVE